MNNSKKIVVFSGSGISAESGISTFRDSGGLWEQYDVMEVASTDGWNKNPELVQRFYNDRRKQLGEVEPNAAHRILAELEKDFDVTVVTQNVDNLHERAGSSKIIHLHGELTKVRSVRDETLVTDIGYESIEMGQTGNDGAQLRPAIVWFGEAVPLIMEAERLVRQADIFAVVGSSLVVYPAAGLAAVVRPDAKAFLVDPNEVGMRLPSNFVMIKEAATTGVEKMRKMLLE
jgi:NAD-dependent deacetylase